MLRRLQGAIDYIEGRLLEDVTLEDVAAASEISLYHLHRVFMAGFGDSLKGYIRKRRLTEVARLLRETDRRIIELALLAGFRSQEAFTRAFAKQYGVPPGRYRAHPDSRKRPGLQRVHTEVLRHRRQGISHKPRLVDREDELVVRGPGMGIDFENDAPIIALWAELLPAFDPDEPLYGVTQSSHPDVPLVGDECIAYIAGSRGGVEGVATTVPPGRYAVFEHRGPVERIVDTVTFAWASWLLASDHNKSTRPDMECFTRAGLASPTPRIELWLSIDDSVQ